MKYIRKFDSAAALQAAIQAGTIERPFVAWDGTANTTNLEFGEETNTPTTEAPVQAHEYVDLGIVLNNKKILFATKNVGADTIYDYGNYYALGEIETKSDYSWNTYKWGTQDALTKYNTTDQKVILDPEDDPVCVNMGGPWRSPTDAELQSLISQTTNTWVTDYQGSGINGRVFTGTNGNTMFVPAAGYFYGTSFRNDGSDCRWWSSTVYGADRIHGRYLDFNINECYVNYRNRYYGFSARGVFTEDV